jgi:triosephosphate isomerase (TIM)
MRHTRLTGRGSDMRRSYVVGNWKMNGDGASLAEAQAIAGAAAAHPGVDVAICPPFTLIERMARTIPALTVGAQDCHQSPSGAHTGSVSGPMLAEAGARLVILGHSERRENQGETDELVRRKVEAALAADLGVILCVGEPLPVREEGRAEAHVLAQLAGSLPYAILAEPSRVAIAYEPIWAIGTGLTPSLEDIAAMHADIRGALGDSLWWVGQCRQRRTNSRARGCRWRAGRRRQSQGGEFQRDHRSGCIA